MDSGTQVRPARPLATPIRRAKGFQPLERQQQAGKTPVRRALGDLTNAASVTTGTPRRHAVSAKKPAFRQSRLPTLTPSSTAAAGGDTDETVQFRKLHAHEHRALRAAGYRSAAQAQDEDEDEIEFRPLSSSEHTALQKPVVPDPDDSDTLGSLLAGVGSSDEEEATSMRATLIGTGGDDDDDTFRTAMLPPLLHDEEDVSEDDEDDGDLNAFEMYGEVAIDAAGAAELRRFLDDNTLAAVARVDADVASRRLAAEQAAEALELQLLAPDICAAEAAAASAAEALVRAALHDSGLLASADARYQGAKNAAASARMQAWVEQELVAPVLADAVASTSVHRAVAHDVATAATALASADATASCVMQQALGHVSRATETATALRSVARDAAGVVQLNAWVAGSLVGPTLSWAADATTEHRHVSSAAALAADERCVRLQRAAAAADETAAALVRDVLGDSIATACAGRQVAQDAATAGQAAQLAAWVSSALVAPTIAAVSAASSQHRAVSADAARAAVQRQKRLARAQQAAEDAADALVHSVLGAGVPAANTAIALRQVAAGAAGVASLTSWVHGGLVSPLLHDVQARVALHHSVAQDAAAAARLGAYVQNSLISPVLTDVSQRLAQRKAVSRDAAAAAASRTRRLQRSQASADALAVQLVQQVLPPVMQHVQQRASVSRDAAGMARLQAYVTDQLVTPVLAETEARVAAEAAAAADDLAEQALSRTADVVLMLVVAEAVDQVSRDAPASAAPAGSAATDSTRMMRDLTARWARTMGQMDRDAVAAARARLAASRPAVPLLADALPAVPIDDDDDDNDDDVDDDVDNDVDDDVDGDDAAESEETSPLPSPEPVSDSGDEVDLDADYHHDGNGDRQTVSSPPRAEIPPRTPPPPPPVSTAAAAPSVTSAMSSLASLKAKLAADRERRQALRSKQTSTSALAMTQLSLQSAVPASTAASASSISSLSVNRRRLHELRAQRLALTTPASNRSGGTEPGAGVQLHASPSAPRNTVSATSLRQRSPPGGVGPSTPLDVQTERNTVANSRHRMEYVPVSAAAAEAAAASSARQAGLARRRQRKILWADSDAGLPLDNRDVDEDDLVPAQPRHRNAAPCTPSRLKHAPASMTSSGALVHDASPVRFSWGYYVLRPKQGGVSGAGAFSDPQQHYQAS